MSMAFVLMIVAVAIGFVTHGPYYSMILTMVFGVTSSGSVFSVHEKCHSDKLYGILPLKKSEMIAGRYLYGLVIGVAYLLLSAILGLILSLVISGKVDALPYWASLAFAFAYFGFAVGVAYPVYLKFSFAKAYVFTMLPMYLLAVLFLVVTHKTNLVSGIGGAVAFFTSHIALLPVIGLIAGLALMAVSIVIANLIYTRKEI